MRWTTVVAAFAVLVAPVAMQAASGDQWIVVRGGSMSPALAIGDVVVVDADGPAGIGDVVTVRRPDSSLVTHRVIDIAEDGSLVLRGDANTVTDPDPVPRDAVVGTVAATIHAPWSVAIRASTSPVGRLTLVGTIVLLLLSPIIFPRRGAGEPTGPTTTETPLTGVSPLSSPPETGPHSARST